MFPETCNAQDIGAFYAVSDSGGIWAIFLLILKDC